MEFPPTNLKTEINKSVICSTSHLLYLLPFRYQHQRAASQLDAEVPETTEIQEDGGLSEGSETGEGFYLYCSIFDAVTLEKQNENTDLICLYLLSFQTHRFSLGCLQQ